ncbi:MAG: hypothetical protein K8W52_24600 [Deltaproteobacteria bacterium]|nr:hypothetical protein [Deltaproteobacteria bacterium]
MTRRTTWLTAGVAGVAVGVLLFWWQHRACPPAPHATEVPLVVPPVASPLPNAGGLVMPSAGFAAPRPRIRRIDAVERQALVAAIERARTRRLAGTASLPTTPGVAPRLPVADLTPASIQTSVREVIPMLAECFDQAAPRRKTHATRITATMKVSGEPGVGTLIDSVDLAADDHGLDDPEFRECLQQTLLAVALPPMPDGGQLEIHYPFEFRDDAADDSDGGLTPAPTPP